MGWGCDWDWGWGRGWDWGWGRGWDWDWGQGWGCPGQGRVRPPGTPRLTAHPAPRPHSPHRLFAHSHAKCRSGSGAFPLAAAAAGLSSAPALPRGRDSSGSLSCEAGTSCPGQARLQTLSLQPRALGWIFHPSLSAELPLAFSRCLSVKLIPGSARSSGGSAPGALGDTNHRVCPVCPPGAVAVPPALCTCRGCGRSGDSDTGTLCGGFISAASPELLCSVCAVTIGSAPTTARGKDLCVRGEKRDRGGKGT